MVRGADVIQPIGVGQWGKGASPAAPVEWSVRKYLLVMIAIAVTVALAVGLGALLGEPAIGLLAAGLPVGLLVAVRPEIGVFLIALYVPMETFGVIGAGVTTLTKIVGAYTLLVLLMHVLTRRQGNLGEGAFWLAVAWAAWSLLTIIGARYPEIGAIRVLTRFFLVGLMFMVLNSCITRERYQSLCWMIFVSSVAAAILSFYFTPTRVAELGRVTVGEINVNEHAANLMGGVFVAPVLLGWSRKMGRVAVVVGVLIVLVGLVATGSRAVYASVLIGLLMAAMLYRRISIPGRALLAIGAVVLIGGLVVLGFSLGVFGETIAERVNEAFERGLQAGGRLTKWRNAAELGMQNPLMGIGFAQAPFRLPSRLGAHNLFVGAFCETGVPGLLLCVLFHVVVFRKAWRTAEPGLRAVLVGLFVAALVANMTHAFVGAKVFWLHMSLCVLGGLLYAPRGRGGETAAVAEGSGLLTRVDAGSPVPMNRRV